MMSQNHQFPCPTTVTYEEESSHLASKIKESPLLPVATVGFLGLGGYRIWQARNRGGQKLSFYLIHTRLAAQGLAVACLGAMVVYSLGERAYKNFTGKNQDSVQKE